MVNTEASSQAQQRAARPWHLAVGTLIAAALVTQFILTLTGTGTTDPDASAGTRLIRFISFFTIQSNILLCAVSFTLAAKPDRREGGLWRVLRLDAVVCMTVTGLVFVTLLRGLEDLEGLRVATDAVFHYIAPVLALVGWFLFGPRPRIAGRTVALALIFPILWAAYTLIRGAVVDWYPYPFVDVNEEGYGTVFVNILGISVLLIAIGLAYMLLDRRLPAAPDTDAR